MPLKPETNNRVLVLDFEYHGDDRLQTVVLGPVILPVCCSY